MLTNQVHDKMIPGEELEKNLCIACYWPGTNFVILSKQWMVFVKLLRFLFGCILISSPLLLRAQLARDFDLQWIKNLPSSGAIIGLVPGSFDPVTIGHRDFILTAMKQMKMDKVVIAVNVLTTKDFNASVQERIDLLRVAFRGFDDKIIITPRPFDDLPALARRLRSAFGGRIIEVLGEDVFVKNYDLVKDISGMEFVMIPRPEETAVRVDLSHYPNSFLISTEFPGVSSSKARSLILEGGDLSGQLDPEVARAMKERGIMQPCGPGAVLQFEEARFRTAYRKMGEFVKLKDPSYKIFTPGSVPDFKILRSQQGQGERFVRDVISLNNLGPEASSQIRSIVLKQWPEVANFKCEKIRF